MFPQIIQRTVKIGLSLQVPLRWLSVAPRCFCDSLSTSARECDLGRCLYRSFAVGCLIDKYPDWNASKINEVVQGLVIEGSLLNKSSRDLDLDNTTKLFEKLGELCLNGDEVELKKILFDTERSCLASIDGDHVVRLRRFVHAKAILQRMSKEKLYLNVKILQSGDFEATLVRNCAVLSTAVCQSREEAEQLACFRALLEHFYEDLDMLDDIDIESLPLEQDVHLGSDDGRLRTVQVEKGSTEVFGFTIRGGEQKVIRDKDFIQRHIITPVFVSHVVEGSPAQLHGMRVGDVLIAINDYNLKETPHRQAVADLKKFAQHTCVQFSLMQDRKELLKYEACERHLDRLRERAREESASGPLGKWHQAIAAAHPEEYYTGIFTHKKKRYRPRLGRASQRLWQYVR